MEISKGFVVAAKREYCIRSFYKFFKLFWPIVESEEYQDNFHIREVCEALQSRFHLSEGPDQLFNLPPGCSKSLVISIFFPAWVWLIAPKTKFITYSYSYKIAEELSGKFLRLVSSDEYKEISKFKLTSNAVSNIKNNKLGQRFVTSTGGSVTGMHADIIIGDDPNSPQAINSSASRAEARRFVRTVLPSRKTSIRKSYSITVQQRLHSEDVTATLLEIGNPEVMSIPAINEKGESFFPSRFPLEELEKKRFELGTVSFMAQYQQITQDESGGIIKKDWIVEDYTEDKPLIYFLDSAYGGENADYNAIVGVYKQSNTLIIQELELNKYEFPELINWMKGNIPSSSKIYIEEKASGKSIIQTLKRETNFNIIGIKVSSSKIERKHACSPFFESGRIIINKLLKNKEVLIEQLIFDNTKNDDAMDVVLHAIDKLLKQSTGKYNITMV